MVRPHSKPCCTSRTSSWTASQRRDQPSWTIVPSRTQPYLRAALDDAAGDHAAGDRAQRARPGTSGAPRPRPAPPRPARARACRSAPAGCPRSAGRSRGRCGCRRPRARPAPSPRRSGRTLKPTTIAFDAAARLMSEAVMPPTPEWIDADRHLGVLDLGDLAFGGLDRALHVGLDDQAQLLHRALLHRREQILQADRLVAAGQHARCAIRCARFCAIWRAIRSFSTTSPDSPAGGGLSKPRISTGTAGPASLTALAVVVVERLDLAPGVAGDHRVADPAGCPAAPAAWPPGPRPTSSRDSMMTPLASALGFAFSSSTSACSSSISSSSSRFCLALAETSTKIVSPPHSSGLQPVLCDQLASAPARGWRPPCRSC